MLFRISIFGGIFFVFQKLFSLELNNFLDPSKYTFVEEKKSYRYLANLFVNTPIDGTYNKKLYMFSIDHDLVCDISIAKMNDESDAFYQIISYPLTQAGGAILYDQEWPVVLYKWTSFRFQIDRYLIDIGIYSKKLSAIKEELKVPIEYQKKYMSKCLELIPELSSLIAHNAEYFIRMLEDYPKEPPKELLGKGWKGQMPPYRIDEKLRLELIAKHEENKKKALAEMASQPPAPRLTPEQQKLVDQLEYETTHVIPKKDESTDGENNFLKQTSNDSTTRPNHYWLLILLPVVIAGIVLYRMKPLQNTPSDSQNQGKK